MIKTSPLIVLSMAILLSGDVLNAQEIGYRVEDSRIVVDESAHFSTWSQASGTVVLVENEVTGAFEGLRPRQWQRDINALQSDIVASMRLNPPRRLVDGPPKGRGPIEPADFTLLDAVETGELNSKQEVLNAFDDDLTTWWEPVFPESRSADIIGTESFFTIDLGRLVVAEKIVLKFVDEENGDPFLLFDVLTSDGVNPIARDPGLFGESPEYRRVFTTLQPNKSQREFEIDLTHFSDVKAEARRKLVHFIRVVARGSAFERGTQITQEQYESMRQVAPQDTGMVEYTKRLTAGSVVEIGRDVWERLDEDVKGPVRYWQRELPRLAEIQVWVEGEDVFQRVQERCVATSCISVTHKDIIGPITFLGTRFLDGNLASKQTLDLTPGSKLVAGFQREVFVDLGSMFWVEGYRHTLDATRGSSNFGPWSIDFSTGSSEVDGSLEWDRVFSGDHTTTGNYLTSIDFDPVQARFMRVEWLQDNSLAGDVHLSEVQLLGEGYQPQVTLVSPAIELAGSSNLVSIEWEAETPPGTSVSVQTRTGTELNTEYCFYSKLGGNSRELVIDGSHCASPGTERLDALVEKFPSPGRGAKPDRIDTVVFVDESKFSPWSEVYFDPTGSPITSPSPRQVMLISATLESNDPEVHATLKSMTVNFDEPVANRLVGSLTPTRIEVLGVDRPFSLVVQLDTLQLGLDELLLIPPAGMELLRDPDPVLYAGTLDQLQGLGDISALTRVVDVLLPREESSAGDSLHLSFAAIDEVASAEAIRLEFSGRLFSPGGRLQAQLRNASSAGGNWQQVDQERNSLVLLARPAQKELFRDLALVPPVFTPNGDDRNEQMQVSFTLLSVGVGTGVEVEIYDLSGRQVRQIAQHRDNSTGSYAIPWDGRDDAGDLVAPGVYTVRIKLAGNTDGSGLDRLEELRTVAVAY